MILLIATDGWNSLVWESIVPASAEPGAILIYTPGIASSLIIAYSYVLILSGFMLMIRTALRAHRKYHLTITLFVLGAAMPLMADLIFVSGLSPIAGVDITPFGFAATSVLYAWGMYRQQMFELIPVARETLITRMSDGVVVLDKNGIVVDFNPAAEKMLIGTKLASGQHIDAVLASWPEMADQFHKTESGGSSEVVSRGRGEPIWVNMRVSPLYDQSGGLPDNCWS